MAPAPPQKQQQEQQRGVGAFAARALKTAPPPPMFALITGAAPGGIGHALAVELAARPGWRVIATARRREQLKSLADLPGIEATLELDVASQKSVDACRRQVERLLRGGGGGGRSTAGGAAAPASSSDNGPCALDVLVNNAGVNVKGTLLDTDMAAVERLLAVNVTGTVAVTKAFAPAMCARRRGLICNVGSAAGYAYGPVEAVYAASKAAVRTLSDGLRVELAPLGVKVMLVAPGFVKSRIDDQPGRSAASSSAPGLWFPPRAAPAAPGSGSSGGGGAPPPAEQQRRQQLDAAASSPYALYAWLSRVVRTSIFELGPGAVHDSAAAFAARRADAVVAEAPRAPRPAPLRARRALAAAAAGGKLGAPAADGAPLGPLPPPAALDMIAAWRWWAPHALGGPLRHYRAAPFSAVTWLVGALVPLFAADLVLGLYMGLWTAL